MVFGACRGRQIFVSFALAIGHCCLVFSECLHQVSLLLEAVVP